MAELFIASGWIVPDSLATLLRDSLPDDHIVVSEPTIYGHEIDMIIVGPPGLFVLHFRPQHDDDRPLRPDADGAPPDPDAQQAAIALRAFLRDEFPHLSPGFYHLLVVTDPHASLVSSVPPMPPELPVLKVDDVAGYVARIAPPDGESPLPPATVRELALALRDRKLTVSQRATEPFTFRSDNPAEVAKVWTVREVVDYIGKHPANGLYHLRNGSLIRWLSTQGALHLAHLARELFARPGQDPEAALEQFLLATRLVTPSGLSIEPKRMHLGHVLPGQTAAHRLLLRREGARGYLFGSLRSDTAWLRVEPKRFNAEQQVEARVTVDTSELDIRSEPHVGHIEVISEASGERVTVPVDCVVVAPPSEAERRFLRPLLGIVAGGAMGFVIGWLFGGLRTPAPQAAIGVGSISLPVSLTWGVFIGLCWAILGGLRGRLQRPAWPTGLAMRRWLTRTALAGAGLFGLALAGFEVWKAAILPTGHVFPDSARLAFAVWALALAVVPSTWWEIRASRPLREIPATRHERYRLRRPHAAALAVVLATMLLVGGGLLYPMTPEATARQATIGKWMADQSDALATRLNGVFDRLLITYYDRRAPVKPTPVAAEHSPEAANR